MLSFRSGWSAR